MKKWGGQRLGAGRPEISDTDKKKNYNVYLSETEKLEVEKYGKGNSFSSKIMNLVNNEIINIKKSKKIKFIDLFSGIGGLRIGFEQAFKDLGVETECILTAEIKPHALEALEHNFENDNFVGDITKLNEKEIENFEFLLAGFPCQAFSSAGNRHGFLDTRGTLFFDVERILKEKKPYGFILENVEGLLNHDVENKGDKIGRTLKTILHNLEELGYKVEFKLLDSYNFGIPQSRKRIFIVGTLNTKVNLDDFEKKYSVFKDIKETDLPTIDSKFTRCLLSKYSLNELHGKAIKDKRGGKNNIHSWDIGIKGTISKDQNILLNLLFKERRKKHWAEKIGIVWMDGMPLTAEQISTFYPNNNLTEMLNDLVEKGYLKYEYPKDLVEVFVADGKSKKERQYATDKPKGYNIVAGKLSFEFTKILDDNDITPTIVAADVSKVGVIDSGIRQLTIREGLRLFGYPETYDLSILPKPKAFDLLGNTVVVPVVKQVASRLINSYLK